MSACPMLRAQCQGRSPALLLAFTFAPSPSSSSQPSAQPSNAAQWRGVLPAASTSFTSPPASTAATTAARKQSGAHQATGRGRSLRGRRLESRMDGGWPPVASLTL